MVCEPQVPLIVARIVVDPDPVPTLVAIPVAEFTDSNEVLPEDQVTVRFVG